MKKPKLVIFDMDGLMLDTEPLALDGWKVVSKELNLTIPDDLPPKLIGLNRELCKSTMIEHMGHFDFDRALDILHKSVDDHLEAHGAPLKPGLIHMLDKLEEMGIKKSVATSTGTTRALMKLNLADIAQRFHVIIGGDQVPYSKPAPDIFLKAAEASGVEPHDCIVLEDSTAGAQGGYSAGMQVIVIPDLHPPTETTRKQAFAICKDLYEACELISLMH